MNNSPWYHISGISVKLDHILTQNDFYAANTYVYRDNLTWSMGRHTWDFGAEFRAQQFNSHGDSGVPQITFDPAQTAGGHGGDAGFGFASFLLGEVIDVWMRNCSVCPIVPGSQH